MNKKRARSAVVIYAIILIVGFLLINKWLGGSSNVATNYSYTEFSADLNAGNIAAVDITQNTNVPTATVDVEFVSGKQLTFYAAEVLSQSSLPQLFPPASFSSFFSFSSLLPAVVQAPLLVLPVLLPA